MATVTAMAMDIQQHQPHQLSMELQMEMEMDLQYHQHLRHNTDHQEMVSFKTKRAVYKIMRLGSFKWGSFINYAMNKIEIFDPLTLVCDVIYKYSHNFKKLILFRLIQNDLSWISGDNCMFKIKKKCVCDNVGNLIGF